MDKPTEKYFEQAEFNMGVSYLLRLNTLCMSCVESQVNLNIHMWYQCLWGLVSELSTRMDEKEYDQFEQRLVELLANVNNTVKSEKAINPDIFLKLKRIEKELRMIIKRSGLETKLMENPQLALK